MTETAPPGFAAAAVVARAEGYGWIADEIERAAGGGPTGVLLALSGHRVGWELALESLRRAAGAAAGAPEVERALWWTVITGPRQRLLAIEADGAHHADASCQGSYEYRAGLTLPEGDDDVASCVKAGTAIEPEHLARDESHGSVRVASGPRQVLRAQGDPYRGTARSLSGGQREEPFARCPGPG